MADKKKPVRPPSRTAGLLQLPVEGVPKMPQGLLSYEPTLREKIANAVYDGSVGLLGKRKAHEMQANTKSAVDFVPGLGDAVGANDMARDARAGNYGMAALSAIGLIPAVGDVVSKTGKKALANAPEVRKVWTGGIGDPMKAAAERGAWFSETEDLAKEYAGHTGRVTAAEITPRNPISFRHAEQTRPIGDIISTALEGASADADLDAARPIVDRLRARYGDKSRPLFEYWNTDKDVGDLFRALGYDAISAAEKSNMNAPTWAALDPSIIKYGP